MIDIFELERYCNGLLDAGGFEDYCPNGLQLDAGRREIQRLATGVTASQAVITAAEQAGADLLLVHHGYFWRGEPAPLTGMKGRRVRHLIKAGIALMAIICRWMPIRSWATTAPWVICWGSVRAALWRRGWSGRGSWRMSRRPPWPVG